MKVLKRLLGAFCASVTALCGTAALAQAPVEVPFFFPVAVGGPITKIIDGFAADFEKENPGTKLRPIYSGSYQDTIAKALTAVKRGDPPVTSISVYMSVDSRIEVTGGSPPLTAVSALVIVS